MTLDRSHFIPRLNPFIQEEITHRCKIGQQGQTYRLADLSRSRTDEGDNDVTGVSQIDAGVLFRPKDDLNRRPLVTR